MNKCLITGITGFAGPHLANILLNDDLEVYGLSRRSNGMETDILDVLPYDKFKRIKFLNSDLLDRIGIENLVKKYQFDSVYHLAAQSHPPTSFNYPHLTFETNVIGSINLIEAILTYSKHTKIMFCSTSEVYGNEGIDRRKILETDTIKPSNPYGNSKAAIDLYMQERFETQGLNGFITRAFSHTGPRRGKIFSISSDAFQLAKLENSVGILEIGNLDTTRVVMDVRDTVNAYYLLMKNEKSNRQIYNVCGDTPRKMKFFTDKLIEISNKEITTKINPLFYRKHDILYQHGDSSKLKDLTN